VRTTQRAIKQALTERYYAWREAEELAKKDEEINLSGEGAVYAPKDFVEDSEEPSDRTDARPNA
jgi:large subunit ribosomal protein L47